MPGSDHVLSKGYLVDSGAGAIAFGTALKLAASGSNPPEQPVKVQVATAATDVIIGLANENLDSGKVGTGKAMCDTNIIGVAKGIAGANNLAVGDKLVATTSGQLLKTTTAGNRVVGMALTASAAIGDIIDVLLLVGETY